MDEKNYTVILADGTTLEYVSKLETGQWYTGKLDNKEIFSADNLSYITIQFEDLEEIFEDQVLNAYWEDDSYSYFEFRDMNAFERLQVEYDAKIDYIAAMTGVDLDE